MFCREEPGQQIKLDLILFNVFYVNIAGEKRELESLRADMEDEKMPKGKTKTKMQGDIRTGIRGSKKQ